MPRKPPQGAQAIHDAVRQIFNQITEHSSQEEMQSAVQTMEGHMARFPEKGSDELRQRAQGSIDGIKGRVISVSPQVEQPGGGQGDNPDNPQDGGFEVLTAVGAVIKASTGSATSIGSHAVVENIYGKKGLIVFNVGQDLGVLVSFAMLGITPFGVGVGIASFVVTGDAFYDYQFGSKAYKLNYVKRSFPKVVDKFLDGVSESVKSSQDIQLFNQTVVENIEDDVARAAVGIAGSAVVTLGAIVLAEKVVFPAAYFMAFTLPYGILTFSVCNIPVVPVALAIGGAEIVYSRYYNQESVVLSTANSLFEDYGVQVLELFGSEKESNTLAAVIGDSSVTLVGSESSADVIGAKIEGTTSGGENLGTDRSQGHIESTTVDPNESSSPKVSEDITDTNNNIEERLPGESNVDDTGVTDVAE